MSSAELTNGWSRRRWLQTMGGAGAGLVAALPLSGCSSTPAYVGDGAGAGLGGFIQITPQNTVHFYQPRAEMGQGVYTGMTTLVAEELGVKPQAIRVHLVGAHPDFVAPGGAAQVTGGSTSMKAHYVQLRQVGANVREAIRQAAAQQLGLAADELKMQDGHVHHGTRRWPYGDFAQRAASQPLPTGVPLKPAAAFDVIGKPQVPLDALAKVTGQAQFGLDVELPNLHHAALQRCPVVGGTVQSYRDEAARAMPGVVSVVPLPHAVAVVASTTWQAKQAVAKLQVQWNMPPLAQHSSADMRTDMEQALSREGKRASSQGDTEAALASSATQVQATYWVPHLAHATMEPMNCTARVSADAVEVWVGTQAPDMAAAVAAHFAGVAVDRVTIHSTFLGGGFGRRVNTDYVAEAVQIAKATNRPVQVVFSREDDMRSDYYRPSSLMAMQGGLDAQGRIQAWHAKRVGANVMAHFVDDAGEALLSPYMPWRMASWLSERGYWVLDALTVDPSSVEGLLGSYQLPNHVVEHVTVDHGVRLGFWRAVGHSFSAFATECFMDELAWKAGQDPVAFRLAHLAHDTRMHAVLREAAQRAGWGNPKPGRFLGVAAHRSFETAVAQVAEVSVQNGSIKVHRISCAVDCGVAVNPDIIQRQMESGMLFGLTAALHGEVLFDQGVAQANNFNDYPLLRMNETPDLQVFVVPSSEPPTGVGEPGVPPVAAAVANAIYAATGQRLRELPLRLA